jgi:nucleoside-diphosphate-sugar epimerase
VDDVVEAICFLSEEKRADGEVFITTDGSPHSSREIYDAMRRVFGMGATKLYVPKILFKLMAIFGKQFKYKVNKLLGDECYSSKKLTSIGFLPRKTLDDMNETDY